MSSQEELSVLADFRLQRMKIPESIALNQIDLGERGRSSYSRIEELAQSIKDNGLIQPLVLIPLEWDDEAACWATFGLDAGGRRYRALQLLGCEIVWHATTSDPLRPGFVIKGEDQGTPLKRLFTEIAENLDRDDLDWRDEMRLLTKAYRLAELEANAEGKHILMRDFGAMIGVGYADLQAATIIHDEVVKNPEKFKEVTGIRAAYSMLLKEQARELEKLSAAKGMGAIVPPKIEITEPDSVEAQTEPKPPPLMIPLSANFFHADALSFMYTQPNECYDHIITDPDYGVSKERLEASMTDASEGVAQENVEQTLRELLVFIEQSWRLIRPQGFLVFFYDLDHHEKLQRMTTEIGFAVQRWPLIWHKTDYRSNAAPAYNFCKNMEYAMVCRKPNATLAKAQMSSIYQCATGTITRELGHPFAKPYELWQWIYSAVCIKGQVVYDPFVGRGSSAIAAAKWGLRPVGTESVGDHYHGLLFNLQNFYKGELGANVQFI